MKKLIAIIAVALPLAFSARAQWIVYDPTMNAQQIINEAQSIAKYVQMINNQGVMALKGLRHSSNHMSICSAWLW